MTQGGLPVLETRVRVGSDRGGSELSVYVPLVQRTQWKQEICK